MTMKGIQFTVILVLVSCLIMDGICGYLPSRIIIVEDAKACFRRALAGKRVTRSLVRRALSCGRVEDCQQECQDEKRFVCEGFNYRLDPSGRANGDCELLDLPMIRMDMRRDIYPDPDYDVYEKDRNGYPDCKGGSFGYGFDDRDRDRDRDRDYDRNSFADRRHDAPYGSDRPEPRPIALPPRPLDYPRYPDRHHQDRDRDRDRFDDRRRPGGYLPLHGDRRVDNHHGHAHYGGGGDYHNHNNYDFNNHRDSPSYLPDRKPTHDRNHWGLAGSNSWGSYGNGHTQGHAQGHGVPAPYDIPVGDTYAPKPTYDMLPKQPSYLPGASGYGQETGGIYGNAYGGTYGGVSYGSTRPTFGIVIPINSNNFGQPKPTYGPSYGPSGGSGYGGASTGSGSGGDYSNPNVPITEDHFPPTNGDTVEHKDSDSKNTGYNFLKDECSLRTATGFRLHKIIVKKYYSVPDIYECETLCFKEKDFQCHSYAYRYTLTSNVPTDNCYLSERNYKSLDFYTDLEPDRDFDIYTMNNRKKCEEQIPLEKEHSDCFWHTRSGQRLDQKIVREATMVKSIVECQLACLRSTLFLCRGFSFRYGSPVIGGPVENCLLTDWPFKEIDASTQFSSELGFEIYERGSFGHGCEPNHFDVKGKEPPLIGAKTDQLCYVGYGTPARLQPTAIRKSLTVTSELDCKMECTKLRHSSLFQCMSFSYRSKSERGETNCDLSDILQRDLLNNVDYIPDKNSWLFAWDHYNPECVSISNNIPSSDGHSGGYGGQAHGQDHFAPSYGPSSYGHSHGGGYHTGFNGPPNRGHGTGIILRPHPHDGPHGTHSEDNGHGRDDLYDIRRYEGPITALDTWRVYSVSGWPCRRGSLCRENKDAGFWYCDLEGGERGTWDYCCRPDHQCGYSEGYNYQWCYVGPERTQWRKCSERYYPYSPHRRPAGHHQRPKPYIPAYNPDYDPPPPYADGFLPSNIPKPPPFRPNRPLQRPRIPPNMPSLNEYESEFNRQFIDPPKPGGFGEPRYWPVSYLHKELPPEAGNSTEFKYDRMKDGRISAIHNLITIIKSNTLKDIKYEINNDTNLLIQVPLPGNFTKDGKMNQTTKMSGKRNKGKDKANIEELFIVNSTTPDSKTINASSKARLEDASDQIDAASEGSSKNKSINSRHIYPQSEELSSDALDKSQTRTGRSRQLSIQDITRHLSTGSQEVRHRPVKDHPELPPLPVPTYKKSYIVRTNKTDRALNIKF